MVPVRLIDLLAELCAVDDGLVVIGGDKWLVRAVRVSALCDATWSGILT